MKKSVVLRRIVVSTVAAVTILSMTAIASEINQAVPIAETDKTISDVQNKVEMKYQIVKGKIISVGEKDKDNYVQIEISNDDMGMILNVKEDAFVINQVDGEYKKVSDMVVGMEIAGILENNSPMTLSIPPMTSGMEGFVILDEKGGNMDLSVYDQDLTNKENNLVLNIDEKTTIVDKEGSKVKYSVDDLKGSELLVLYHASTRSIPAQTSPDLVMILEKGANTESTVPSTPVKPELDPEERPVYSEFSGLREICESLGYTIEWKANDKPVVLVKDDVKIEITVGSNLCSINGVTAQMETAPKLEGSKITITDEYKTVLEKYLNKK